MERDAVVQLYIGRFIELIEDLDSMGGVCQVCKQGEGIIFQSASPFCILRHYLREGSNYGKHFLKWLWCGILVTWLVKIAAQKARQTYNCYCVAIWGNPHILELAPS